MGRVALLVAAALLLLPAEVPAATITLSGSSSAMPVVADLAYFYRREVRRPPHFEIVGGGTAAGLADTARGIVSGGMLSRDLTPNDPQGLVFTPFALSGVCLVSNRANPVPNFTRAQLQDLVSGRTSSGTAVALDLATGARSVFLSVFVDVETPLNYVPRTFSTAAQVRTFILGTPDAWGYLDVAYTRELHTIPYEGIPCTRATIVSGAYPGRRPLGIVTRGRPRGELAKFLRWIARDATARRVIATRYIVP